MAVDYNVQIVAVDTAMDCYERVSRASGDLRAAATFDLSSIGDAIGMSLADKERELDEAYAALAQAQEARQEAINSQDDDDNEAGGGGGGCDTSEYDAEIERINEQIAKLNIQIARLGELMMRHSAVTDEWTQRSAALMGRIQENEVAGKRMMAAYIRKIQGVDGDIIGNGMATNPYTGQGGYVVVTIDSQRYPETAEHVRVATREGHPAYLTLDRSGSAQRRQQSLAGIRARGADGFDRDEYPPAAFSEGGTGAHVAYMSSADNRGSGSSFARQLQGIENGTRVRFRVI